MTAQLKHSDCGWVQVTQQLPNPDNPFRKWRWLRVDEVHAWAREHGYRDVFTTLQRYAEQDKQSPQSCPLAFDFDVKDEGEFAAARRDAVPPAAVAVDRGLHQQHEAAQRGDEKEPRPPARAPLRALLRLVVLHRLQGAALQPRVLVVELAGGEAEGQGWRF